MTATWDNVRDIEQLPNVEWVIDLWVNHVLPDQWVEGAPVLDDGWAPFRWHTKASEDTLEAICRSRIPRCEDWSSPWFAHPVTYRLRNQRTGICTPLQMLRDDI